MTGRHWVITRLIAFATATIFTIASTIPLGGIPTATAATARVRPATPPPSLTAGGELDCVGAEGGQTVTTMASGTTGSVSTLPSNTCTLLGVVPSGWTVKAAVVDGVLGWATGTGLSGTAYSQAGSLGTLTVAAGSTVNAAAGTVNEGTITTDGTWILTDPGTFTNDGTINSAAGSTDAWQIQCDTFLNGSAGTFTVTGTNSTASVTGDASNPGTLENAGTMTAGSGARVTLGSGAVAENLTTDAGSTIDNAGTFDYDVGLFDLKGGTITASGPVTLFGNGQAVTTIDFETTLPTNTAAGADTFAFGTDVGIGIEGTIPAGWTLDGGTSGATINAADGTINDGTFTLSDNTLTDPGTFTNNGAIDWAGSSGGGMEVANLVNSASGTISVSGTETVHGGGPVSPAAPGATENSGSITVAAGAALTLGYGGSQDNLTTEAGSTIDNSGSLVYSAGTLDLEGGTITASGALKLTGGGTQVPLTLEFGASLPAGTVTGSDTIDFGADSQVNLEGTIPAGWTVDVGTSGTTLDAVTGTVNDGTIVDASGDISDPGTFTNGGNVNFTGAAAMNIEQFDNAAGGLLSVNAPAATVSAFGPTARVAGTLDNAGEIQVTATSRLSLGGSGNTENLTTEAGSTIDNSGTLIANEGTVDLLGGTITPSGPLSIAGNGQAITTLEFGPNLPAGTVAGGDTITSPLDQQFSFSGTIPAGWTLAPGPGNTFDATDATTTNDGTIKLTGGQLDSTGTLVNNGTLEGSTGTALELNTIDNGPTGTITIIPLATGQGVATMQGSTTQNIDNKGMISLPAYTTLSVNNLTEESGSTLATTVNGPQPGLNDGDGQITSTADIALGGTLAVTTTQPVTQATTQAQNYWPVIIGTPTVTGQFASVTGSTISPGLAWSVTTQSGQPEVELVPTAVAIRQSLTASAVAAPTPSGTLVPGSAFSSQFTITNTGTPIASASWTDSVYLGTGSTYSSGDRLIARVPHTGALASGASYTDTFTGTIPGITAGSYNLIVVPDSGDVVSGTYQDTEAASASFQVGAVPILTPNTPVTFTVPATGGDWYYQLAVPPTSDVIITPTETGFLNGPGLDFVPTGSVYASTTLFPSATNESLQGTTDVPATNLRISSSQPGTWYLDIHMPNETGFATGSFQQTIDAETRGLAVDSAAPTIPVGGPSTIAIVGTGFGPDLAATLTTPAPDPQTFVGVVHRVNSTDASITFDLPSSLTKGVVGAIDSGNTLTLSSGGQEVTQPATVGYGLLHLSYVSGAIGGNGGGVPPPPPPPPQVGVDVSVSSPGDLRNGWTGTAVVTVSNVGTSDASIPVLKITATDALVGSPGTTPSEANLDLVNPDFTPSNLLPGTFAPGVLAANTSKSFDIPFVTTLQGFDTAHENMTIQASTVDNSDNSAATPIDWTTLLASDQPPNVSDIGWATIVSDVQAVAGTNEATYSKAISSAIADAQSNGFAITSEDAALNYLVQKEEATGPGAAVSGTVTDTDTSSPVSKADLTLTPTSGGGMSYGATTWYDGRFAFFDVAPGTYSLQIQGYLPRIADTVTVGGASTSTGLTVDVNGGGTVSGTIAAGANPVSGAVVTATDPDGSVTSSPTGPDGTYTISGLEAGPVTVSAAADGFLPSGTASVTVVSGATTTANLTLGVGGAISGTISDPGASGDGNALVNAVPATGGNVVTGEVSSDGTYTVSGLASGTYIVVASDIPGGFGSVTSGDVSVTGTATTAGINLGLTAGATVTGKITDANTGSPLPGVVVSSDGPGAPSAVTTATDGSFTLSDLPAGVQDITAVDTSQTYPVYTQTISASAGGTTTLNIAETPAGSVTITVQDSSGSPLGGQVVTISPPAGDHLDSDETLITDGTGQATYSGLGSGTFGVQVAGTSVTSTFTIDSTDVNPTVTLTVPDEPVTGNVETSGGTPASGVTVALSDGSQQVATTTTAADGSYGFFVTGGGPFDIVAYGPGIGVLVAPDAVTTTTSPTVVPTLTAGAATLNVTVTGPGGSADANAEVTLSAQNANDNPADVTATTDSGGVATFSNLSPGDYVLSTTDGTSAVAAQPLTIAAGSNALTVALAAAGSISGSVTAGGSLLAGATVVATPEGGGPSVAGTTASDGTYSFSALPAATYDLSVSDGINEPGLDSGVVVTAGGAVTADVALAATGTSVPVTVDPSVSGGAVPPLSLTVENSTGAEVVSRAVNPTVSGPSAAVDVGPLAPGAYTLVVSGQGMATVSQAVTVGSSTTAVTVTSPGSEVLTPSTLFSTTAAAKFSSALPVQLDSAQVSLASAVSSSGVPSASEVFSAWLHGVDPPNQYSINSEISYAKSWILLVQNSPCPGVNPQASSDLVALINQLYQDYLNEVNAYNRVNGTNSALFTLALDVAGTLSSAYTAVTKGATQLAQATAQGAKALEDASVAAAIASKGISVQDALNAFTVITSSASIFSGVNTQGLSVSNLEKVAAGLSAFAGALALIALIAPELGIAATVVGVIASVNALVTDATTSIGKASELLLQYNAAQDKYNQDMAKLNAYESSLELAQLNDPDCLKLHPKAPAVPQPQTGKSTTSNIFVGDPNGIEGTPGYGSPHWVSGVDSLSYVVNFENEPTATTGVVEVTVTEPVPSSVDPASVQLTGFGFGTSVRVVVPPGQQTFTQTLPAAAPNGDDIVANGVYDRSSSTITWTIEAIDPLTGDVDPAADAGWLPPDDSAGAGEGYVTFTASPTPGLATGTTVPASATVVFDRNAPISTTTWSNTIDDNVPEATVEPLPATTTAGKLTVTWAGSDGTGAGVASYDVYVSVDGGPLSLWQTDTTATSATYATASGHRYGFAATATNDVGTAGGVPDAVQTTTTAVGKTATKPPVGQPTGYLTVASDGGVFTYGTGFHGSLGGVRLNAPIVGIAPTHDGKGYWMVASDGGVFAFGDARFYGSTGGAILNAPIVGIAATPDGKGYWLVASDGGVFNFGDARFYGSTGGSRLDAPIVAMASTSTDHGYWLVASDGGVFAFGDARFYGSTGGAILNAPIVGVAATPDGKGYWLVASDGGVFNFGDAKFHGSTGGVRLNRPVVGIAATPTGLGYWLVASDGGIFNFGDAKFHGSTGDIALRQPVVGIDVG